MPKCDFNKVTLKWLLLKPGPAPWAHPDPGPWTRTLDPGAGSWTRTLKNLDPEKPGL